MVRLVSNLESDVQSGSHLISAVILQKDVWCEQRFGRRMCCVFWSPNFICLYKYVCARFYRLVISARYVNRRRKLAHLLLHLHERRLITLLGKWQRLHRSLAEDTSKASLKAIYVCSLLKISQARVTRVYSLMLSGRFKAGCENLIKFNKLLSTSLHSFGKMV